MSLIDSEKTEKDVLKSWAEKHSSDYFTEKYLPCQKEESYYKKFEHGREIECYSFETIQQLQQLFTQEFGNEAESEKLGLPLSVAAFKERAWETQKESEGKCQADEAGFNLPEFVYNF